ncbi:MAG: hypothetical protein F4210_11590 [Holophagales bacterium]|nr:hypothetical protein [Holophagales bacterium]MYF96127.1 hypothetical protein [Holophagales bacterium]
MKPNTALLGTVAAVSLTGALPAQDRGTYSPAAAVDHPTQVFWGTAYDAKYLGVEDLPADLLPSAT